MVYFPVLCHVYLCLEFWHNERSFAKCVQAMGKNCNSALKYGFRLLQDTYCHGAARGIQERGDEEYNKQGI